MLGGPEAGTLWWKSVERGRAELLSDGGGEAAPERTEPGNVYGTQGHTSLTTQTQPEVCANSLRVS